MDNIPQFDIEMLQKSAPYSAPFVAPHVKHYPPHFIPQQPSMFGAHGSTIPPQYLPPYRHPGARRGNFNPYNRARKDIWCETCEWSFTSLEKLEQHRADHKKCDFEGCAFEGHPRILGKHMEIHTSGNCSKVQKVESAEDIAKWREERRKNYPTAKNIELRRKAHEEKNKRGERITESKARFGDRNKKYPKGQRQFKKRNPSVKAAPEVVSAKDELNQGVSMFRGTSSIENYVVEKNALSNLLSVYGSASESENDEEVQMKKDERKSIDGVIQGDTSTNNLPEESAKVENDKAGKLKRKHPKEYKNEVKKPTKIYKGLNYDFLRNKQPPTMLSKLLEKEIRHERNVLLQCVRYVVENDFLGVEKAKKS